MIHCGEELVKSWLTQKKNICCVRIRMISLEKCASILNCEGNNYSIEEIRQIREFLYTLASIDELIRGQSDDTKISSDIYTS